MTTFVNCYYGHKVYFSPISGCVINTVDLCSFSLTVLVQLSVLQPLTLQPLWQYLHICHVVVLGFSWFVNYSGLLHQEPQAVVCTVCNSGQIFSLSLTISLVYCTLEKTLMKTVLFYIEQYHWYGTLKPPHHHNRTTRVSLCQKRTSGLYGALKMGVYLCVSVCLSVCMYVCLLFASMTVQTADHLPSDLLQY